MQINRIDFFSRQNKSFAQEPPPPFKQCLSCASRKIDELNENHKDWLMDNMVQIKRIDKISRLQNKL